MQKSGKIELDRIIAASDKIGSSGNIIRISNDDPTRIVFDVSGTGYTGFEISKELSDKKGIVIEMADLDNIVLIASVMNKDSDFRRLKKALKVFGDYKKTSRNDSARADHTRAGKVSDRNLILYPPGTPVIFEGEKFSKEDLDHIEKLKKAGGEIIEC